VVDAIGRLIQGRVSAGQVHDVTQAGALLEGVPAKCVVADKAYDAMALREQIAAMPAKAVIPPRVNRRESIRRSKAVCATASPHTCSKPAWTEQHQSVAGPRQAQHHQPLPAHGPSRSQRRQPCAGTAGYACTS
jgi:IS5 family transposase